MRKEKGRDREKDRIAIAFLSHGAGRETWNILWLILVQSLLGVSSVFYALLLRDIINAAVAGEKKAFFICITGFALLVCGQLLLRMLLRFLNEYTKSGIENRMKERLFAVLLQRDYASVSQVHSGEWMNRLTSDTVVVADGMTEILPGAFGMAVKLVGAVVAIIVLEPRSAFLILPGGFLLLLTSTVFRKKMKKLHNVIQETDGKLRIFLQDILGSMVIVRSFAVEEDELR